MIFKICVAAGRMTPKSAKAALHGHFVSAVFVQVGLCTLSTQTKPPHEAEKERLEEVRMDLRKVARIDFYAKPMPHLGRKGCIFRQEWCQVMVVGRHRRGG